MPGRCSRSIRIGVGVGALGKAGVDPHTFERWAGNAGLSFEREKESV